MHHNVQTSRIGWPIIVWLACSTALSGAEPRSATLRIDTSRRGAHAIPKLLTGKFTEHLFNNIYHGIDAQVLRNPTFAEYPFWTGQQSPDGVSTFHYEQEKIAAELRRGGGRWGWPDTALDTLVDSYADGLACWWSRVGPRDEVQPSPDTAPFGQRAQRIEVKSPGQGICQFTWLPLHRVRRYQVELYLRSAEIRTFTTSLKDGEKTVASSMLKLDALGWNKISANLEVEPDAPAEHAYAFCVTADQPGQFVIGHAFLRPGDHVEGTDPDVVRFLKESRMPLHRWPGGNFVSGYHWEDGVGPIEQRPTLPNYAWGNVEPNTFGTDEFIRLCRATGSEPMICINAGDGTPEEAARWIEYCNGSTNTAMGKRRAANGHAEPYRVRHWEVGNELWGRWQVRWTTGKGYAERYLQFARAMAAADPTVRLYACGAPVHWGKAWNDALISRAAGQLTATTDHPLIGGDVSSTADPLEVFQDFMAVPDMLEGKWRALSQQMLAAGIRQPRLAITELQMFAHLRRVEGSSRLTHQNLVNPATLAEALYDTLFYHTAVRLAPFVELLTHSATVNHGGGLRKERERVYPNPCYYAQAGFAEFAGAWPVEFELDSPVEKSPMVLPDLKNYVRSSSIQVVDALAAISPEGDLLISIVHRAGAGPTRLAVSCGQFSAAKRAQVRTLSGPNPWAANSLRAPEQIKPVDSTIEVTEGRFDIELAPYSALRVRLSRSDTRSAR